MYINYEEREAVELLGNISTLIVQSKGHLNADALGYFDILNPSSVYGCSQCYINSSIVQALVNITAPFHGIRVREMQQPPNAHCEVTGVRPLAALSAVWSAKDVKAT
jgi:hypothetical protein